MELHEMMVARVEELACEYYDHYRFAKENSLDDETIKCWFNTWGGIETALSVMKAVVDLYNRYCQ